MALDSGEKIKVEIFNRFYDIDPQGMTPIEAHAVAQFVSERMRDLQKDTGLVDTSRLAVLTALNIADELMRLKVRYENMSEEIRHRASRMLRLIQQALD